MDRGREDTRESMKKGPREEGRDTKIMRDGVLVRVLNLNVHLCL